MDGGKTINRESSIVNCNYSFNVRFNRQVRSFGREDGKKFQTLRPCALAVTFTNSMNADSRFTKFKPNDYLESINPL